MLQTLLRRSSHFSTWKTPLLGTGGKRREKGDTILRVSNHCGGPRKVPTMSQLHSSIQYICVRKTSGSNIRAPTLFLAPGATKPRYVSVWGWESDSAKWLWDQSQINICSTWSACSVLDKCWWRISIPISHVPSTWLLVLYQLIFRSLLPRTLTS